MNTLIVSFFICKKGTPRWRSACLIVNRRNFLERERERLSKAHSLLNTKDINMMLLPYQALSLVGIRTILTAPQNSHSFVSTTRAFNLLMLVHLLPKTW